MTRHGRWVGIFVGALVGAAVAAGPASANWVAPHGPRAREPSWSTQSDRPRSPSPATGPRSSAFTRFDGTNTAPSSRPARPARRVLPRCATCRAPVTIVSEPGRGRRPAGQRHDRVGRTSRRPSLVEVRFRPAGGDWGAHAQYRRRRVRQSAGARGGRQWRCGRRLASPGSLGRSRRGRRPAVRRPAIRQRR